MNYKHESAGKRPMWLLYCLAAVAIVLACFALYRAIGSKPKDNDNVKESDGTQQEGNQESGKKDDNTDSAKAKETEAIATADKLAKGYFYDEAIEALKDFESDDAKTKVAEYEGLKAALVPYTGQYYHVFFHSLIIDTALAFDNKGNSAEGYNMWMTTQSEFKKMLPLLLQNNFVLYDITQMVELDANGKAQAKAIYLPAGKKPLVISIDDVDYYDYMKTDGFADRLDVDDKGRVVTVVKDASGNESITYDGDVMPILDSFVDEHPEFSFRGAKGIVATTGFAGAFGYRITDLDKYSEADGKAMLAKVQKVAQALRSSGWQISSHSYTHNQYWNKLTITMDQMKYDTGRWKKEIEPYVGNTNIFISPFGVHFDKKDQRFRYLLDEGGFNIYCPVGANMSTTFVDNEMIQERLDLDGYTMIKHPERVSKYFFDPALVLDSARPPIN
ncbi:MAG: hypothetical protein VB078_03310 [Clostridiaceae bacterium]|nr:hypothetical protein [Clostridiaceae bacterium]